MKNQLDNGYNTLRKLPFVVMIVALLLMTPLLVPCNVKAGGDNKPVCSPSNVKASLSGSTITITWHMDQIINVAGFDIYYHYVSVEPNELVKVTSISRNDYKNDWSVKIDCPEKAGDYYFGVEATTNISGYENSIRVDTPSILTLSGGSASGITAVPNPDFGFSYSSYNRQLDINWAIYQPSGVNKYVLYKSTKSDSGFSIVCEKSYGSNYYYDKDVIPGKTYYYKLAFGNNKGNGPSSPAFSYKIPTPKVNIPTGFSVTPGVGVATLTFNSNPGVYESEKDGFEIYKDGAFYKHGVGKGYFTRNEYISETKSTSFKIRAYVEIDGKKYYSDFTPARTVTSRKIKKPTGVRATKISGSIVSLMWNPVEGATSYVIYKGSKKMKKVNKNRVLLKKKGAGSGKYSIQAVRTKGGKTWKTKSNKVKPKPNQRKYPNSISVSAYPYATCRFIIKKISLKGKTYTVTGYAVNNRIFKAKKYKKLTVTITSGGKIVAKKTFKNKAIGAAPSKAKKMTLKIKGKKNQDLVNNGCGWSTNTETVW